MNVYKTKEGTVAVLTKENFERDTMKKTPYYIEGKEHVQYAVCPACNNPIMILGLYKKLANTDTPYAKHCSGSINGLANYNLANYMSCPYANPRKLEQNDRREPLDGVTNVIIDKIRNEFDCIIRFLSDLIGCNISYALARKMLETYVGCGGYLYRGATLVNYPLMVGYFSNAKSLYGQQIIRNSELEDVIINELPEAMLDENNRVIKNDNFFQLDFVFIHHDISETYEPIKLMFIKPNGYGNTVLREIKLEYTYEMYQKYLSVEKTTKDVKMLAIAEEII